MQEHDTACRFKHMAVTTDLNEYDGCDCALIDHVLTRREQQIAAALWTQVVPIVDWIAGVNMVRLDYGNDRAT